MILIFGAELPFVRSLVEGGGEMGTASCAPQQNNDEN